MIGQRLWRGLWALALVGAVGLSLPGCKDAPVPAPDGEAAPPRSALSMPESRADDPAMAMTAAQDDGADSSPAKELAQAAQVAEPEPTAFTVDVEGRRVFVPREGWRSADEFRYLYENRPQDLPSDIDHDAMMGLWEDKAQ